MIALHCPTCGHSMDKVPVKALRDLSLPRQEREILDALVHAYPRQVTLEHLIHVLYSERLDGGPLNAVQVVRTRVAHLRTVLPPTGWAIPKFGDGSSSRYRLQPVEER